MTASVIYKWFALRCKPQIIKLNAIKNINWPIGIQGSFIGFNFFIDEIESVAILFILVCLRGVVIFSQMIYNDTYVYKRSQCSVILDIILHIRVNDFNMTKSDARPNRMYD